MTYSIALHVSDGVAKGLALFEGFSFFQAVDDGDFAVKGHLLRTA